jgi:Peptidase family M23
MRRILALLPVLLALQVGVSPALAWTWPADGPVLRPFSFDRGNPYAGGQHRGVDIGAAVGRTVVAPVSGTVTFAGTVPGGGLTLAIRTGDGYSATLVHLGSLMVARGTGVQEGAAVGVVGSTGQAELGAPHVHLGVRIAADEQGYVDPLGFLPARGGSDPPASPPPPEDRAAPKASAQAEEQASAAQEGGQAAAEPASPASTRAARREGRRLVRERGHRAARERAVDTRASRTSAVGIGLAQRARFLSSPDGGSTSAALAPRRPHARRVSPLWALSLLLLGAGFAVQGLRRQVRDAGGADRAAAMLPEVAPIAAEDAGGLRASEHDHVVVHGDLERVLLAEAQALPDLDGNDDPAELVHVPDNAGGLSLGLRSRRPQGCARSHRRSGKPLSARSLR